MPVKKKRTGHTDYRTGGMFYSKFNKGGILEKFFLSPQKGGPPEEKVMEFKDSLIAKGELPKGATLAQLVKYVREQKNKQTDISTGQVPRTGKEWRKMRLR